MGCREWEIMMTMSKYAASETETYIFQSNAYTCVSYAPVKRGMYRYA